MINVHPIEGGRLERVTWLLEELGQPYEIVFRERASAAWRAGAMPTQRPEAPLRCPA